MIPGEPAIERRRPGLRRDGGLFIPRCSGAGNCLRHSHLRMKERDVRNSHPERSLIPNILQEPFGRDHPALVLFDGLLVDPSADRGELQTLVADVAIERDLVTAYPALAPAGDEIAEGALVAALAAIHELRAIAAEAGLRVLRRDALHLLGGAADEGRRGEPALVLEALGLAHLQTGGALAHHKVELRGARVRHLPPPPIWHGRA